MTDITEISVSKTHTGPITGARGNGSTRHINNQLSIFLIAMVALSPIPLGSNRPFFAALTSMLVAAAALIYGFGLWRAGSPFRYQLSRLKWLLTAFSLVCIWMIMQVLPIGLPFGGFELAIPGDIVQVMSTLSIAPGETWLSLIRFSSYGLFFFLMLQVCVNHQRANKMLFAVVIIAVAHAIYAMVALTQLNDTLLFFEKWSGQGVATGTFVNRNSFAMFLGMGAVTALAMAIVQATDARGAQSRRRGNVLENRYLPALSYLVAWGVIMGTILVTESRMGMFVAVAGSGLVGALTLPRGRHANKRVGLVIAAALAAGGIMLAMLYGAGVTERLGSVDSAADVRLNLYYQVIDLIGLRPFTGFGAGTFNLSFPLVHAPGVSVDLVWHKAHNTYLSLWAEMGIIFGSLPILLLMTLAVMSLRRAVSSGRELAAPAAAFAAIIATGLHSLVDFGLEIHTNMYLLLALIAIGIAPPSRSETDLPTTGQKAK